MTTAADVVVWARSQLDVPWRHQARLPGVAMDCAGLVICAARSLGLVPADFDVNGYSRAPDGTMLAWCEKYMTRLQAPETGAVVVLATQRDPQHLGILVPYRHGGWAVVHANNASIPARVVENRLIENATTRVRAYYRLPGLEN